jgi:uncharacterized lipoprotein
MLTRLKVTIGVAALAPLLLCMSGCHFLRSKVTQNTCNKPQPYQSQHSDPALKVPPGLDAPSTGNALKIPALNEPAPPARTTRDPCLDYPPSYKVVKPPPQA